jgi:hypothetical protein
MDIKMKIGKQYLGTIYLYYEYEDGVKPIITFNKAQGMMNI